MEVDSFRFLSPLIKRYYQLSQVKKEFPIPFTRLRKPLDQLPLWTGDLGGLYHRGHDRPFDQERERREPPGRPELPHPAGRHGPRRGRREPPAHQSHGRPRRHEHPSSHRALQGAGRGGASAAWPRCLFLHGLPGLPLEPVGLEGNPTGQRCATGSWPKEWTRPADHRLTGVRSQRARAGTSLRSRGDVHRTRHQHALLVRARRRPALVAVEFPFGHILGQAHNPGLQRRVILQALDVLEQAGRTGSDRALPGAVARAAGSGPPRARTPRRPADRGADGALHRELPHGHAPRRVG